MSDLVDTATTQYLQKEEKVSKAKEIGSDVVQGLTDVGTAIASIFQPELAPALLGLGQVGAAAIKEGVKEPKKPLSQTNPHVVKMASAMMQSTDPTLPASW